MIAKGISGSIELDGDVLRITKALFFGKSGGPREIPVEDITAVHFQPAGIFSNGHIQFAHQGNRAKSLMATMDNDPDAVTFTRPQQVQFQAIHDAVRERGRAARAKDTKDPVAEIMRLDVLRKQGLLTDDEFEQAKRKALGI